MHSALVSEKKAQFGRFTQFVTPQKLEVFAKVFDPPKHFKICYIFMKRKPKVAFSISFYFIFSLMNALVYVDIDQRAFIKEKSKVA